MREKEREGMCEWGGCGCRCRHIILHVKDEDGSIIDVCNIKRVVNRTRLGNRCCKARDPARCLSLHRL